MDRPLTKVTDLMCSCCGTVSSIQRRKTKTRGFGHEKHLWCYSCKEITKHIELVDKISALYKIQNKIYNGIKLTPNEELVCKFLMEGNNKGHAR